MSHKQHLRITLLISYIAIFICPTYFLLDAFSGRSHKVRSSDSVENGIYSDAGIEFVGRVCHPTCTPWRRRLILLPRKYVSLKLSLMAHLYSYRDKCACIQQRRIPGVVRGRVHVDRQVVRSERSPAGSKYHHASLEHVQYRSHGNVVQHDGEWSAGDKTDHDRYSPPTEVRVSIISYL